MKISEITVSYSRGQQKKQKVSNSKESYEVLLNSWNENTIELQEEFKILLLNRSNQVLGVYPMSKGGVSGTIVDAKLVFGVALKCNASSIIVAHNHPSGNLRALLSKSYQSSVSNSFKSLETDGKIVFSPTLAVTVIVVV